QGAKRRGPTYTLPVAGGQIDPTEGKGEAKAQGMLFFTAKSKSVPLRDLKVKATRQPLIAKVGGSQLKLATSKQTSSRRAGFGTKLTSTKLKLTQKLITRLNKKLRPKLPFKPNQPLGTLTANAQPALVTITEEGSATLDLDPAFLQKLDQHFVSLNPIAPAQRFGAQASFPLAPGGAISPDGSKGTLRTAGALEFLQLGAGQVFWSELWLDLGANSDTAEVDVEPTPAFPGKVGRVGVLDYVPTGVSADPKARRISAAGSLSLSAQAAATFNEAFAQGQGAVFAAGEAVGTLGFGAVGE
ncbi:MAG TPA: hypothetical protein VG898_03550, partial [Solirubrobacterales bacterium]|nr:hypothetical protein [Solirubrobacterales bacterium]